MLPNTGLVELLLLIVYFVPSPSLLLLPPLQHCLTFSLHGGGRDYGGILVGNRSMLPAGF